MKKQPWYARPYAGRQKPARFGIERLEDRSCPSITFVFDYSLDSTGFFNSSAARAVLEQAGRDLGAHLSDTLAAISPGGGNHWSATFANPSGSGTLSVSDLVVPTNTIYVFAGGRNYGGTTVGEGGPGGWSASGSSAWFNLLNSRGQSGALATPATDVGPWGGSLTFGIDTNWSFGGPGVSPAGNQYDFYSVALHELGHLLGLGTASSWDRLVSGGHFNGQNAYYATDGAGYPALDASTAHWAPYTTSGGAEPEMTPSLTAGLQKTFTPLDWAGLADIGWQVDTSMYASVSRSFGTGAVHTGVETVGVFDPSTAIWYLHNSQSAGAPDAGVIQYGAPGWIAVAGDWNGDGVVSLGVYDSSTGTWYLRNSNSPGAPNYTPFQYGAPGWLPVVGDWLGTGHTGIGVFDPTTGTWYLRSTASPGMPDLKPFQYGGPGWRPVTGDWAGAGHTGIGVFDPAGAVWYLRNTASPGVPDITPFQYGGSGWLPVAGDWTGNGHSSIGVVNPATETWYLRYTTTAGAPNVAPFSYGGSGWIPVVGAWGSSGTTTRRAPDQAVPLLVDPAVPQIRFTAQPSSQSPGSARDGLQAGVPGLFERDRTSGSPSLFTRDAWLTAINSLSENDLPSHTSWGFLASELPDSLEAWLRS